MKPSRGYSRIRPDPGKLGFRAAFMGVRGQHMGSRAALFRNRLHTLAHTQLDES